MPQSRNPLNRSRFSDYTLRYYLRGLKAAKGDHDRMVLLIKVLPSALLIVMQNAMTDLLEKELQRRTKKPGIPRSQWDAEPREAGS